MKIAVNTRFLLVNQLEGFGKFTLEIFKRLVCNHPEHTFYFLFDRQYSPDFIFAPNVVPVVLYPSARHPVLFYIWYEFRVAHFLKKEKIDLLISPDGQTCLATNVPRLTVLHDLAFEHYPEHLTLTDRYYFRRFTPKFARHSDRIVTVSEFTKQDVCKTYGISPAKIDVVYNAASDFFRPSTEPEKRAFRAKHTEGEPFFMFVGALHPRKNLERVLEAFDHFRTVSIYPIKLLIIGRKAWRSGPLLDMYNNMIHKDEVIFSGRLNDEELRMAYGAAQALIYVPLLEGFGIPIVEAQQCECPVITSNTSSMPEVAGKAAILADPFSVEHITAALTRIASDRNLCLELISQGKRNVMRFNWNQSAVNMWAAIEKTIAQKQKKFIK